LLNPTKCESKIFSLRKYNLPPEILIDDTPIPWNPDDQGVKYLGVYLDKKLNWNLYLNNKLTQAYACLSVLFPLINKKSSLKPTCTVLLYKTILRPLITYACPVWGNNISASKLNKIQIFQNKVLRIAANCQWFIRNTHVHQEFGIDTIKEFIIRTMRRFFTNLHLVPGAVTFNIGEPTAHRRLKARLPQDVEDVLEVDE